MIIPTKGNIVGQELKLPTKTASGLHIDRKDQGDSFQVKVSAVAEDITDIKVGDVVIRRFSAGTNVKVGDENYVILERDDILATVKD